MEKLELLNGETVNLTLNFKKLMEVRAKDKNLYKQYNNVVMNGMDDILEGVTILYVAYLCGLQEEKTAMSQEEFIENLQHNISDISRTVNELMYPKKPEASEKHSEAKDGRIEEE